MHNSRSLEEQRERKPEGTMKIIQRLPGESRIDRRMNKGKWGIT